MTVQQSINRGFNLLVTAVLFFGGLAFGTLAFSPVENDIFDKLDDIGLVLIGFVSVGWYLIGGNRYKRSAVPLVLAVVALAVQIVAIPLETDDPAAFGDNIGGLILLAPFVIFVVIQYIWTGRQLQSAKR